MTHRPVTPARILRFIVGAFVLGFAWGYLAAR